MVLDSGAGELAGPAPLGDGVTLEVEKPADLGVGEVVGGVGEFLESGEIVADSAVLEGWADGDGGAAGAAATVEEVRKLRDLGSDAAAMRRRAAAMRRFTARRVMPWRAWARQDLRAD
jgi:hypothetical protein